jgi:uncharacterized membrane protein HdeD (DUF308 family)
MLTVFYGLLVMSLRPVAIATVAVLAAIAFLVAGVGQVLLGGGLEVPWRWFAYAGGVIAIVAGIAAFAWPGLTLVVLAVITAWAFVVNGLVRLVSTLAQSKRDLWWLGLVVGAAELLLGLWAIGSPGREGPAPGEPDRDLPGRDGRRLDLRCVRRARDSPAVSRGRDRDRWSGDRWPGDR